ncbi:tetratricopeptide repeat protein [Salinispira pacifica]|uniref:Tetratricopeptide repeat protein n=1 Tax=Salinispira pacifica TaxID=1307761 RepID=V5WJE3_9SPIO|nr:hypothetical protein [Salinispira pacifica]AHC15947.1 hypothetical protein L21SP2_2595 [Salinispira pacifica]
MNSLHQRIFAATMALLIITAATAVSQEAEVSFLSGEVLWENGRGPNRLQIGDEIAVSGSIILEGESSVELNLDGNRVFLGAAGTYSLRRIYRMTGSRRQESILQSLEGRFRRNIQDRITSGSAAAGVRGDDSAGEEGPGSIYSTPTEELFARGLEALREERIQDAFFIFEEAYYAAPPEQFSQAALYLAYCEQLLGNLDEADDLYNDVTLTRDDGALYALYVLSSAELQLKQGRGAEALENLNGLIDAHGRDGFAMAPADLQQALYLRGLIRSRQGNDEGMKSDFKAAAEINANPQLTIVIEELLWGDF